MVVQVAGDAVALLVGGHDAEPPEHAGVVDGDAERLGEPVQDLGLLLTEVVGLEASTAISPTTAPRARSAAYSPDRPSATGPAPAAMSSSEPSSAPASASAQRRGQVGRSSQTVRLAA